MTSSAVGAWTDENANSSSLVALDPTCDNGPGGKISGSNATVRIVPAPGVTGDGGYVHVNSSCATHPVGAPDQCTNGVTDLKIDSANLITPHAYVHGACTLNGANANFTCPAGVSDCLTEGASQIGDPLASLIAPTIEEVNAAYGVANCPNGDPSTPTSDPCDFRSNKCDDVDGTPACEVRAGGLLRELEHHPKWRAGEAIARHLLHRRWRDPTQFGNDRIDQRRPARTRRGS